MKLKNISAVGKRYNMWNVNKTVGWFYLFLAILMTACSTQVTSQVFTPQPPASVTPTSLPHLTEGNAQPGQYPYSFHSTSGEVVRYLLYLPDHYDQSRDWPLIVFFHGNGEIGMNIQRLAKRSLITMLESQEEFPFIVVSPQLPSGLWPKYIDPVDELLNHLSGVLSVDTNRMFITGISAGGYGVWNYLLRYPERFAAAATIAGPASLSTSEPVPEDMCIIKELPIWVFHGEPDITISPELSKAAVEALESCGGLVSLTIYPDAGHQDAWLTAYSDPTLFEWFLEHSR